MATLDDVKAILSHVWLSDAGVFSDAGTTPAVNGGPVQQIDDQDGSTDMSGGATLPTFRTNRVNGLPAIDTSLGGLLGWTSVADIRCVVIVARHNDGDQDNVGILGQSAGIDWVGEDDGTKVIDSTGNASPLITGGTLRINGVSVTPTASGNKKTAWSIYVFRTTGAVSANQLHDRSFTDRIWDGEYAFIGFGSAVLSDAQVGQTIEAFLAEKYGIAVALAAADWSGQPALTPTGSGRYVAETPAAKFVNPDAIIISTPTWYGVEGFSGGIVTGIRWSLHGGPWAAVTTRTPRPYTHRSGRVKPVWGFWFEVDPADLVGDGWAEIRAIVDMTNGVPIVLSLFVVVNAHGSITSQTIYWDRAAAGGGSGTIGSPFNTWHACRDAVAAVADRLWTVIAVTAGLHAIGAEANFVPVYPVKLRKADALAYGSAVITSPHGEANPGVAHRQTDANYAVGVKDCNPGPRLFIIEGFDFDWDSFWQFKHQEATGSMLILDRCKNSAVGSLTPGVDWTLLKDNPFAGGTTTYTAATRRLVRTGAFTGVTTGMLMRVRGGTGITPTPAVSPIGLTVISADEAETGSAIHGSDFSLSDFDADIANTAYQPPFYGWDTLISVECEADGGPYAFYGAHYRNIQVSRNLQTAWANSPCAINHWLVDCHGSRTDDWAQKPHGDLYQHFGTDVAPNVRNRLYVNGDNSDSSGYFPIRHGMATTGQLRDVIYVNCITPTTDETEYSDIQSSNRHVGLINPQEINHRTLFEAINIFNVLQAEACFIHQGVLHWALGSQSGVLPQFCRFTLTNNTGSSKTYSISVPINGVVYTTLTTTPPADVYGIGETLNKNPCYSYRTATTQSNPWPLAGVVLANEESITVWFNIPVTGFTASGSELTFTADDANGAGADTEHVATVEDSVIPTDSHFVTHTAQGSGATSGDPGYLNAAARNYRPGAASILLKANRTVPTSPMVPYDVLGIARGAESPIGAYAGLAAVAAGGLPVSLVPAMEMGFDDPLLARLKQKRRKRRR